MTPEKDAALGKKVRSRLPADLRRTGWFFVLVAFLGILALSVRANSWAAKATCLLWILACFTTGAAAGFLFGIPKIFQGKASRPEEDGEEKAEDEDQDDDASYRQQVNTNLTEISDWLTKIIVGLGLVQLGKVPDYLGSMATLLAGEIDSGNPPVGSPMPSSSAFRCLASCGVIWPRACFWPALSREPIRKRSKGLRGGSNPPRHRCVPSSELS